MNHKDLLDGITASMSERGEAIRNNQSVIDEEERVESLRNNDDQNFIINIPMITGRVYKVDAREVNWDAMVTPESQANLEANESTIRTMVHHLITADFTNPETEQMLKDFDESIMNLFTNFGIDDPGYEEFKNKTMVKPYVLLLGKCFDALTLISVIAHNAAMHSFATQVFGITSQFNDIANLNDITDMDNSVEGLITEDRKTFEGADDHDVSGLLEDDTH